MSREGANTAHRALVGNYPHCTDVKTECQKKTKALKQSQARTEIQAQRGQAWVSSRQQVPPSDSLGVMRPVCWATLTCLYFPQHRFLKPSGGLKRRNQLILAMIRSWARCHRFLSPTSQDQAPLPALSSLLVGGQ